METTNQIREYVENNFNEMEAPVMPKITKAARHSLAMAFWNRKGDYDREITQLNSKGEAYPQEIIEQAFLVFAYNEYVDENSCNRPKISDLPSFMQRPFQTEGRIEAPFVSVEDEFAKEMYRQKVEADKKNYPLTNVEIAWKKQLQNF
jgi:hypothetical protein